MNGHREHANFALLRDPLFLGPRMRIVYRNLHFACFLLNNWSSSKMNGHQEHANFALLRDPLFLGPRMRTKIGISILHVFC